MLLELLEFPYREVRVDTSAGAHKTPDYLAINPLGVVPGLTVGGVPIAESVAQMIYLADLDPGCGLAPRPGSADRPGYLQWMVMIPASLEQRLMPLFRAPDDGEARKQAVAAMTLQTGLFVGPNCLGDAFTALDVLVHWNMSALAHLGLMEDLPLWQDYVGRHSGRLDWSALNA